MISHRRSRPPVSTPTVTSTSSPWPLTNDRLQQQPPAMDQDLQSKASLYRDPCDYLPHTNTRTTLCAATDDDPWSRRHQRPPLLTGSDNWPTSSHHTSPGASDTTTSNMPLSTHSTRRGKPSIVESVSSGKHLERPTRLRLKVSSYPFSFKAAYWLFTSGEN